MATIRIKQDRFGRWSGYVGVGLIRRFTGEYEARNWMVDRLTDHLRDLPQRESNGRKGFTFKYTGKTMA